MSFKWKDYLFRTYAAYIVVGLFVFVFCDFNQAKRHRLWALHDNGAFLMEYYKNGHINDKKLLLTSRYFKILNEVYPSMIRAKEMRGLCNVLLGNDQHALELFEDVLKQRPSFFWVEFEKGMALYRLKRWKEASAVFNHIAAQSDDKLLQSGVLPSLKFLPLEMHSRQLTVLKDFVLGLKEFNHQMIVRCLFRQGKINLNGVKDDLEVKRMIIGVHPWIIFVPSETQPFFD